MNRIFTTKGWLVFLLVLSILGLIAYTFVGFVSDNLVKEVVVEENVPEEVVEIVPEIEQMCFEYSHPATEDEPQEVKENIKLEIDGGKDTGEKKGTQNGPELTNGYFGELKGTLTDNTLELVYSYTVEGSKGKEKEIYKITEKGLEKQRYSLIEEGDVLVPDLKSELKILSYTKKECEMSQQVEGLI